MARMRSEGYGTWSVCLCLREIWHYRHQTGIRAIRTSSARQARENVCVASVDGVRSREAAKVERLVA